MKYFATIAYLLLSASAIVSAGCYKGGTRGDKAAARAVLPEVCTKLSLGGSYNAGTTKMECREFNHEKRQVWLFLVTHIRGRASLSYGECMEFLGMEIGCKPGGETTRGDWFFRADPGTYRALPNVERSCRNIGALAGYQADGEAEAESDHALDDEQIEKRAVEF